MNITKEQYEIIQDIYRERRRQALEKQQEKRAEIDRRIPQLAALEDKRLKLALVLARAQRDGNSEQADETKARMQEISLKKEKLLAENGYTPADLEPAYTCPLCHDTGRGELGDCSCLEKLVTERFYSDEGLQNSTQQASLADFSLEWYDDEKPLEAFQGLTARRVMAENLTAAKDYAAHFSEKQAGLLLTGPVGTGKTFLCSCLAGELSEAGVQVLYVTAQEFFEAMEGKLFDREERDKGLEERIARAGLLIIDDLGTEFTGRKLAANALFTVLNERLLSGRSTLISTNCDIDELAEQYSPQVASRLVGCFKILFFTGPDIRLVKKLR